MYLVRPSDIEINVWESLLSNMTGAAAWGWDSLFAAMKKVRITSHFPAALHERPRNKSLKFISPLFSSPVSPL